MALRFEWDRRKAAANLLKHGVSFEEAQSVFYDEHARLIDDPDHSNEEERFVLLGLSRALRLLIVCHCTGVKVTLFASSQPERPRRRKQGSTREVPTCGKNITFQSLERTHTRES